MKRKQAIVFGRLVSSSPRYEEWHKIFEDDEVPIEPRRPYPATFGNEPGSIMVYDLAIPELRPVSRERLVDFCVKKFGDSRTEVYREIDSKGFPIREEDVTIPRSLRAFI